MDGMQATRPRRCPGAFGQTAHRSYQCAALVVTSSVFLSRVALGLDFLPPETVELSGPGAGPRLAVGDLDQDCISDLVALRNESDASDSSNMRLVPGDGLGGFPDPTSMVGGRQVSDIELVDLNGDGIDDMATSE
jgi:hypothetical protein